MILRSNIEEKSISRKTINTSKDKSKFSISVIEAEEQSKSTTCSEIFVFGSDSEGQLGLDNLSYNAFYSNPRFIVYQINVVKISCGWEHSIVQSEMGICYAMGNNKFGQIGLGPTIKKCSVPTLIPYTKDNTIWDIAAGGNHTIFYTRKFS